MYGEGSAVRKILWFTLGFGAACAFCAYGRLPALMALPALVLLTAFLSGEFRTSQTLLAALGILGGLFWFARFEARTLRPVYELDGITREAEISFHTYSEKTDYGSRAEGSMSIDGNRYSVMVYLDTEETVEPGTILSGPFRFQVTAPGGRKESAYYQGEGVFLLARQEDELTAAAGEQSW